MFQYYDKAVRGTENEDKLVILQFLSGMIGQTFSFLNYYKEIPVSYDSTLLSVENEMAEFAIHEYQAKQLLRQSGVPVPEGVLCVSAGEARQAAEQMLE